MTRKHIADQITCVISLNGYFPKINGPDDEYLGTLLGAWEAIYFGESCDSQDLQDLFIANLFPQDDHHCSPPQPRLEVTLARPLNKTDEEDEDNVLEEA